MYILSQQTIEENMETNLERKLSCKATELILYIENDGDLYRQRIEPIRLNLMRKMAKGTYNHTLACKLWGYLTLEGSRKYCIEFGCPLTTFSTQDRNEAAKHFADEFLENCKLGEFDDTYQIKKGILFNHKQYSFGA